MRGGGRILLLPLLVLSAGCYTFRATEVEAIRPGIDVRASLNPAGEETVLALTGERHPRVVGRLERLPGDSVVLSVWRTDLITSSFQPGRIELPLRRDQIAGVEEKRLSGIKTGSLVAGIAAGLYLFVRVVWQGTGGGLLPGGGGGDI
jgi:hypothetical protein